MGQFPDPLDGLAAAGRAFLAWLRTNDTPSADPTGLNAVAAEKPLQDAKDVSRHTRAILQHLSALVDTPSEKAPLLPLAAAWLAAGRPDETLFVINMLAECGVDTGDIRLHECHALWAMGRFDEALQTVRQMAARFPDHLGAIETAAMMELQRGNPGNTVSIVERLLACADVTPSPTLLMLAAQGALRAGGDLPPLTRQAVEHVHSPMLGPVMALLATHHRVWTLWKSFFITDAPGRTDPLPDRAAIGDLLSFAPSTPVISVGEGPSAGSNSRIENPYAFEENGFVLQRWTGVLDCGPLTTSLQERRCLSAAAHRLQEETVRNGQLTLISPFGGKVTSSFATVLHMAPTSRHFGATIAYYFDQPRPSFALVTTEDQWPLAWYDPVAEVIVRHRAIEDHDLLLQDRVRELKHVWLACPDQVRQKLAAPNAPRKVALLVGLLDYISTHIFTDLQGLQHICERALVPTITRFVVTGPEPYGPVEQIFPELQGRNIERFDGIDEVDLNTRLWANDLLPVRVAGGIVSQALPHRLMRRATLLAMLDWKQRVSTLIAQCWPVLFVSLRTHSRRWQAAPAQIAGMLLRVRDRHPRLAVMWDGHSATDTGVPDPVREESELASAVQAHLPDDLPFLALMGRSIHDAIYAAAAADLHLSAQGTSATKAFLIAGKPGVIIGPRHFGWDVRAFRDPQPPALVPWQEAKDLDPLDAQTDFAMSPELIAEQLLAVAANVVARPGRSDPRGV